MISGESACGIRTWISVALTLCTFLAPPTQAEPARDGGTADAGAAAGPEAAAQADGGPLAADAGVGVDGAPTPAAPLEPDPLLVQLRNDLQLVASGQATADLQVDHLFTFALDDPAAIVARLQTLPKEIEQFTASSKKLTAVVSAPEKNYPVPPPQAPLALPEQPVEPSPPAEPEPAADPLSDSDADRTAHEERVRIWSQHKIALEGYSQKMAAWQALAAERELAEKKYTADVAAWESERSTWLAQRQKELLETELNLDISRLRLSLLGLLSARTKSLSKPAQQAFQSIVSSRSALRAYAEKITAMVPALTDLSTRLETLSNRLSSGALLGFASEREVLEPRVKAFRQQCDGLLDRTRAEAGEFEGLAQAQEGEGRQLRQAILLDIFNGPPDPQLDQIFNEHLRALRRLTRRVDRLPTATFEPQDMQVSLAASLSNPEQLGTIAEAEQALAQVAGQLEDLNRGLQVAHLDLDRWRLAFEREQNTLLAALASAQARTEAYSLSSELLADLQTDLVLVMGLLEAWALEKWTAVLGLPEWVTTAAGTIWLLRLVMAILLLVFVIKTRQRASSLALWLLRRARSVPAFQGRVGALIRWAGLLQAILPTMAMWLGGYVALLLLDFAYPEVRFVEVAFFWLMLYALGRQILIGLTRQISRGRPALLPTTAETANLLRKTYGRMGLFLGLVAIVDKWSLVWMGAGTLSALVRWAIWLWFFVWGGWAAFAWRRTLGASLSKDRAEGSTLFGLGQLMIGHWYAALFSPLAFAIVLTQALIRLVRARLDAGGFFAFLRARTLRRLSRKDTEAQAEHAPEELPEEYRKEFPLFPILGEEGPVLIPREKMLEQIRTPILGWRNTRKEGSLVLVGEKGIGKTTLLALLARRLDGLPVLQHSIQGKIVTAPDLLAELAPVLGYPEAKTLEDLATALNDGEERVVLLDEAHNLFLRKVDGYQAFDALVRLVTNSSQQVYWVLAFNSFAWEFINQSRKRVHYFRRLLKLPDWTTEALQDLITRRNKRSAVQIVFDEVILDEGRSRTGDLELIENTEGYFRLLRDSSAGNPRVATFLWLRSLRPQPDGALKLGLFREESAAEIEKLDRELLFALAAYCEHENLSQPELREVLNISDEFASFAVRFLIEYGYLEPKGGDGDRATLGPRFYRQVLQVLRKRHLVFEGE